MLSCWRVSKKKTGNSIHAQEKDFLGYLLKIDAQEWTVQKNFLSQHQPPTLAENSSKHLQRTKLEKSPFFAWSQKITFPHGKTKKVVAK